VPSPPADLGGPRPVYRRQHRTANSEDAPLLASPTCYPPALVVTPPDTANVMPAAAAGASDGAAAAAGSASNEATSPARQQPAILPPISPPGSPTGADSCDESIQRLGLSPAPDSIDGTPVDPLASSTDADPHHTRAAAARPADGSRGRRHSSQKRRWTPFSRRSSAVAPVGGHPEGDQRESAASVEIRQLRAEVATLRDILERREAAQQPPRGRGESWVQEQAEILEPAGQHIRTLTERLTELDREVQEAKKIRLKTEIIGVLVLLSYLVIGAVFYTQYEGWSWAFALYFCVVVATTVGYGDQGAIQTDGGMLFTCCFVFFGVALVLGLGTYLVLQVLADRSNRRLAVERNQTRQQRRHSASEPGGFDHSSGILQSALSEADHKNVHFLNSLKMPAILMLSAWAVWILFFTLYPGENLTFVEALYMTIVTGTTVGFGDYSPETEAGRAFATPWLIVIVVLTTTFLGRVAEGIIPQPDDFRLNNVMLEGPKAILELCDTDGDGDVEYYEWFECLCLATGKVDAAFIKTAREHFDCLEGTGDGKITQQDVDIQEELYNRWRLENDAIASGQTETESHSTLVRAMGMAWIAITRNKKRSAVTAFSGTSSIVDLAAVSEEDETKHEPV